MGTDKSSLENLFSLDEQRKSTVDIVIDKIKTLLINEQIKPGDLLPGENTLSESLNVSRGSIREAMKILCSPCRGLLPVA